MNARALTRDQTAAERTAAAAHTAQEAAAENAARAERAARAGWLIGLGFADADDTRPPPPRAEIADAVAAAHAAARSPAAADQVLLDATTAHLRGWLDGAI